MLARQPGIDLIVAMRGGIGLELAARHHPDLILLDLHLPDVPGEEVLRRLQGNPATRGIPVVVVSADAIPAQIDAVLAAGAKSYVTKPLEIKPFLELVRELLKVEKPQSREQAA